MRIKKIVDLTYLLYPDREQRQLRLTATKTLETTFVNEFSVEMNAHIGTHVEGPYHCLNDGKTIGELPAEIFVGDAAIVDLTARIEDRAIRKIDLIRADADINEADIVLLKTGYGDNFPTEEMQSEKYMADSPYLTDDAVDFLVNRKIKLLGIDFWSVEEYPIDPKIGEARHKMLFKRDIPLIHSLTNMAKLETNRVFFFSLPLPIIGLDSSPVRAIAVEWM